MKSLPVWLDLDQQGLDAAYDQARFAANQQQLLARYASNSELARERLGQPLRFAYGDSAIEALDVYPAQRTDAPVCIFLHGGAWRSGLARNYAFLAELFVQAGAHLVVPDFVSVLETGGDLMPMAVQVRRAIAWVHCHAGRFGGNASRITVCGHSSGAHLAAVALSTPWERQFGLPADILKGGLCCSGVYDLKPVGLSARSSYLRLTPEIEQALSPLRHLDAVTAPVIVAYGSLESPEFQRQSCDFSQALKAAGKPVQLLVAEAYNHFEILETLASPYGALGRAALGLIRLGAPPTD